MSRHGRLRLTLRTARSLPPKGLSTLGFDAGRFPPAPPACYRASWQLPGPDSHRQATTSLCWIRSTQSTTSNSGRTLDSWETPEKPATARNPDDKNVAAGRPKPLDRLTTARLFRTRQCIGLFQGSHGRATHSVGLVLRCRHSGHETAGRELVVRLRIYGRLTGTQGLLGERRLGRPVFARWAVSPTFRWPPLRLARLCCEHEVRHEASMIEWSLTLWGGVAAAEWLRDRAHAANPPERESDNQSGSASVCLEIAAITRGGGRDELAIPSRPPGGSGSPNVAL
jgi:hypothetical protein